MAFPQRKTLIHAAPSAARFGAIYFITICCKKRGGNQLCHPEIAKEIFSTILRYDQLHRWHFKVAVLMPDHLHLLVSIATDFPLTGLIRSFKRITARMTKLQWQRNFFDHRLRHDESTRQKADYILQNPVRAKLVAEAKNWPYVLLPDRPGRGD